MNIHKDCENYNGKKDYCLKFFEENVSERYKTCREYSEFNAVAIGLFVLL